MTTHDPVNHPTHYTSHPSGVECIQITEHMTFNVGNAVKYLWRADLKNGDEDLRKAAWYIEREIARRAKAEILGAIHDDVDKLYSTAASKAPLTNIPGDTRCSATLALHPRDTPPLVCDQTYDSHADWHTNGKRTWRPDFSVPASFVQYGEITHIDTDTGKKAVETQGATDTQCPSTHNGHRCVLVTGHWPTTLHINQSDPLQGGLIWDNEHADEYGR
jgi:hypothetical protein